MNAIYARAQDGETQDLKDQIARCQAGAESQGVHVNAADIYTDAGGWDFGARRIGLRTLTESIEKGSISAVYVDTLGRLGRSGDIIPVIERWQRKGVTLNVVSDRVHGASSSGRRVSARHV